jgi:hypothetical protein
MIGSSIGCSRRFLRQVHGRARVTTAVWARSSAGRLTPSARCGTTLPACCEGRRGPRASRCATTWQVRAGRRCPIDRPSWRGSDQIGLRRHRRHWGQRPPRSDLLDG